MMKRILDIVIASLMLLATLPLWLVCATTIWATSPGPILHWSKRAGRNGGTFQMPKFRTMHVGTPQLASDKLADAAGCLTPSGGFLRKLSLDELPQLLSVLTGDMSLVGPRPALFNQYELIAERNRLGIDVLRPGITGWAQINGRDNIPEWRKVQLDQEYLQRRSLSFDMKIMWLTGWRVITRSDISH